jgi:hypothetical protein
MLEMMPQPPAGSRQSKKCCAELVITPETTTAEARPDDRVKRLTAAGAVWAETSNVDPVDALGEMLGDTPEMARLIGQARTGDGFVRQTSVRQRRVM